MAAKVRITFTRERGGPSRDAAEGEWTCRNVRETECLAERLLTIRSATSSTLLLVAGVSDARVSKLVGNFSSLRELLLT